MGPAQAKALRPKRSKFTRGTSRRSPLEDRRHRFGVCSFSSEASLKSQVVLLQTAHSWANAGVLLGARMHRERVAFETIKVSG